MRMCKLKSLTCRWIFVFILSLYNVAIGENEKKVICYLNNNKLERNNNFKFNLDKVNVDLCTHLIYSFAVLHEDTVIPWNKTLDVDLGGYSKFNQLKSKNPQLKTMISIRELPNEFSQFSTLLRNGKTRFNFIKTTLNFIKEYGFDGIDIIWWHPGLENGSILDKRNYFILLKDIRKIFTIDAFKSKRNPYLISIGVPYDSNDTKQGYDIIRINRFVDWFNIMSYDSRDLFLLDGNNKEGNDIVDYYVKAGASREKIILGTSTYGLIFDIDTSIKSKYSNTELLNDPYKIFESDAEVYVLSSAQICENVKDNPEWKLSKERFGSYTRIFATSETSIIIFKDIFVLRKEAKNALNLNLGGMSFWTIDQDDFNGLCIEQSYPLISIAKELLTQGFIIGNRMTVGPLNFHQTENEQAVTSSSENVDLERDRIVCYTTNWSVYRTGTAKFDQFRIDPNLCTHLIYAYAKVENEQIIVDKNADINLGGYANCVKLRKTNKNLKILIGLRVIDNQFSKTVDSPEKREIFIKNVLEHLKEYEFDGADIAWKYPGAKDKDNFVVLLNDLRTKLVEDIIITNRSEPYLISINIPPSIEDADNGYDLRKLNDIIDWYNLLSFDYHLSNENKANHHSPLYAINSTSDDNLNVNASVNYYLRAGIETARLVVGIPTFGISFTLKDSEDTDIGAMTKGPGKPGKYTNNDGMMSYFEICGALQSMEYWKIYLPYPGRVGPYAVNENQWIGYDDEMMVKIKAEYVAEMGLGGIMFWTIDQDDFRGICGFQPNILIQTAKTALLSKIKQYELDLYFKSLNFDVEIGNRGITINDDGSLKH